jgi:hypothetical protein
MTISAGFRRVCEAEGGVVAVVKGGQPVRGRNACTGQVSDRGQADGEGGVPVAPARQSEWSRVSVVMMLGGHRDARPSGRCWAKHFVKTCGEHW